jgi:hypothetical protein
MGSDSFWRWFDRLHRADFAGTLLSLVFDWKTYAAGLIGWLVSLFGLPAISLWSPAVIWIASLACGAFVSIMYVGLSLALGKRNKRIDADGSVYEPNIDARKAFFEILRNSKWRQQQLRNTTDTRHLVPNWLEVRLDVEIHKALRNSRISSWGEECLQGTATTPEKPIPAEIWDKVEINFDRSSAPRTAAHFKGPTSRELGRMAWVAIKFSDNQIFDLFPLNPLEIIFDPTNPGKKFWSIEQMRDESGKQVPGSFWEYRALIKNTSPKTLRNVKVTVEAVGILPSRPEPSQFDINKKHLIDLTPDEEVLVLIRRWFNPPIVVGMLANENAYGPIKMTASADDVFPTTKIFRFEPERTPMIFELDTDA